MRTRSARKMIDWALLSTRQYAIAAAPQVLGLVTQILIIKVFFVSAATQALSAYQFALTVSSIFYLGLAYQQTFIRIRLGPVVFSQLALFLIAGLSGSGFIDRYFLTLSLFLSYFLTISLIQYAVLRVLNGNLYIAVSAIISVASPQLLWIGEIPTAALAIMLFFAFLIWSYRRDDNETSTDDLKVSSLRPIFYSILLQSPLLTLALFDPLLAVVVGPAFYVNFVLLQKITNGIALLAFSRTQLKIVLKQYRISNFYQFAGIFVFIALMSAAGDVLWGPYALPVRCILLSLNINVASMVIRDHLQWGERSHYLLAISVGAVLAYGTIIYSYYYFGWMLNDVVTLMIVLITVPTLCVMIKSQLGLRASAVTTD